MAWHYPMTLSPEQIDFLRRYGSWPAWRRWLWRTFT